MIHKNERYHIFGWMIAIAIPLIVGFSSSLLTGNIRGSFEVLNQPAFSPPGWIFPIVWSILFTIMGIASYRVYIKGMKSSGTNVALTFYGVQLLFNFFWSLFFFRWELRGLAFLWLIVLWILIGFTGYHFHKIDRSAAYLMLPYLFWVSFAGVLNYSIWVLNR